MKRLRRLALVLLLTTVSVGAGRAGPAAGDAPEVVARGVSYRTFTVDTPHGGTRVHLVKADLSRDGVRAGLLHTATVTGRAPVSQMARAQGAVAAVNGDFFHITETQHPGVPATGAPSGPSVADGRALSAAVPQGQRFGWTPRPGDTAENVVGVGTDGRARSARLTLSGYVDSQHGRLQLRGLNQYALPVGSIGVFDPHWGTASRARAVCGTDTRRAAPCTSEVYEVTVRHGAVVSAAGSPGTGPVDGDSVVLLGREAGARALRSLTVGTPVQVHYNLASSSVTPFRFALGAHSLLTGRQVPAGLDDRTADPRTAVGIADAGHTLYLLATDGREGAGSGLTLRELASALQSLGCDEGLYLDGGGSTTLATRDPESGLVQVRNQLDQGQERRVPNGIALFAAP